jgi:large conductance mechanosensitive channel
MSVIDEFKVFVSKGNVVDLAVAVVLGGAFGKIVTALVGGLVMPLVGYVMPQGDWQKYVVGPFQVGPMLAAVIDFLLIALVVFVVFVKGLGRMIKRPEPAPVPPTKTCPECLETVPLAATRCKFCTSKL